MPIINLITKDFEKFLNKIDSRSDTAFSKKNTDIVKKIIDNVRKDGDKALKIFTKKFDKVDLTDIAVDPVDLKIAHDYYQQCPHRSAARTRASPTWRW